MLNSFQMRFYPFYNWRKRGIIHQNLILGMVHDVDQVFVKQPDINRMDHPAKANGTVPRSQMAVMVHRKRGDPVAFLEAHCCKRLR